MPDQIIREIPLIARYSRHNEAEDFRFRTFLKVGNDLTNAELDAVVKKTTDGVWSQIDCTTCANCCRTFQIVVDNKDIQRLATRLGTTPAQFTRRFVRRDEDKIYYFSTVPCPFLGEDNRCTVYEDRPQACRDFPFLHAVGFRHRTLSMIENCATCPIVFNVWQELKRLLWPLKGRR